MELLNIDAIGMWIIEWIGDHQAVESHGRHWISLKDGRSWDCMDWKLCNVTILMVTLAVIPRSHMGCRSCELLKIVHKLEREDSAEIRPGIWKLIGIVFWLHKARRITPQFAEAGWTFRIDFSIESAMAFWANDLTHFIV